MDDFLAKYPTLDDDVEEVVRDIAITRCILAIFFVFIFYIHKFINCMFKTSVTAKENAIFWGSALAVICFILLTYGTVSLNRLSVYEEIINDPRFPVNSSLTMFIACDLHLFHKPTKAMIENLNNIIKAINKTKPDIVVINGDILSFCTGSSYKLDGLIANFFEMIKYPTYFTIGNHDICCMRKYMKMLKSKNVVHLNGNIVKLNISKRKDVISTIFFFG